ncbi:hypothetical protein SeMB42_g02316 [Synchytrium endobioticum]|uniref:Mitochondrial thiamine pyrophosphate carrier 1 n=1 Tax=Synchytrium endobioticum TaxID=286115 RepID=A0A507D602_9FUNG|nr:hypothetical protein SeLEV6574_g03109 [Synchytrium endobioticum]TPX50243.1 hypothetical protein SeMB42_g02316 [Synchytrium endobioticum]
MTFTGSPSFDQAVAGFLAGAASTLVLHPLDLIKTRFQVNEHRPRSILALCAHIRRHEGPAALYRGVSANLAGACVSWGLYFWWYGLIKESMRSTVPLSAGQHLLASATAGAACALLTNPLWVVKTRMCAAPATHPGAYASLAAGLVAVARSEGLRGLYRGLVPALFGVSHGALQFMAYEELKIRSAAVSPSTDLGTPEYIAMAASSKLFATVCTYPYQVVRARLQNQYGGPKYTTVRGTITTIWRNEGVRGFYKGLAPNVLRVLPGTMITFAVYEALSKFFRAQGSRSAGP